MNPVDIIFAIVLVLAMLRGYSRGLLGTAAGYVAPVLAFMLAADWSDPVRDRIAAAMPLPDFVLDILAPFVVFVVVVATVRLAAAFFARLLGVGLSVPSRLLASAAGVLVSGLVLGSFVILVHQMKPDHADDADDAGRAIAGPVETAIANLDHRFAESLLAPPLAELASDVVSEAISGKDAGLLPRREDVEAAARKAEDAAKAAAVDAVKKIPLPTPERKRDGEK